MQTIDFLKKEERLAASLTALYKSRGYREYRMRTFEEYSLYLDHKDFLPGPGVITFSGMDGKLLALRPDVTLSVIKNAAIDLGATEKLFYNEKVYRVSQELKDYKEISQIGVEVLGAVDHTAQAEVLLLVIKTLSAVGQNYLVDLSHMGYVNAMLENFSGTEKQKAAVLDCLKKKNVHDFTAIATELGLSDQQISTFRTVVTLTGENEAVLEKAEACALCDGMTAAVQELRRLIAVMRVMGLDQKIKVNFSIANNSDYYNGVIFNGYIEGVPHAVLTGGRYDKLLQKFGKNAGAIGFALYLGELERYFPDEAEQTDILLVCSEDQAADALCECEKLIADGYTVRLTTGNPQGLRYKRKIIFQGGKQ